MPPLQNLNVKHFLIAHLLAQGKSGAEVARRLNISPATIYNCQDTPEFVELLETLKAEYAEKVAEKAILPFAEMQRRIDQEALGAFSRVVDISEAGGKEDSVRLKASLAIMDRASNTPKQTINNPSDGGRQLFDMTLVQLVMETASQVGDKTIFRAAKAALEQIPAQDADFLPPIDAEVVEVRQAAPSRGQFAVKTMEEVLAELQNSEEED